jgi:nicotinamide-nucleotide amidase
LLSIGIAVVSVYTVGDDINKIVRSLKRAVEDADIVIVTGGLGPTDDDLTRQAFAEYLNTKLQLDSTLLDKIRGFFTKRNMQMPEKNAIQACIPEGASPIKNPLGTAPGVFVEKKCKMLFALPGVPFEMKQMLESFVLPHLERQGPALRSEAKNGSDKFVVIKKLRCFGAGESVIAEKLGDLMHRGRNPLINSTVSSGVITLHVVATGADKKKAQDLAQTDCDHLRSLLGELIFGVDDQTLPEVVGRQLARLHKTIAVAESCTGGLVAKLLTDIPGSSEYFTHGWVAYSNKAKIEQLGVAPQLIEQYGAVSEQVATALAQAVKKIAQSDFSIAITGIAGPAGGTEQKPVGLVYISVTTYNDCVTKQFLFSHTRDAIRQRAALTALNMLRLVLNS